MLSTTYLLIAAFLSTLGLGFLVYGKKAPSLVFGIAGIALMGEPCFIFDSKMLLAAGVGTIIIVIAAKRFTALS